MANYKEFNREIKGYVETIYSLDNVKPNLELYYYKNDKDYELSQKIGCCDLIDLYDTSRNLEKYAVLYDNYISLDGSFYLFNKEYKANIFISNKTIEELNPDDNVIYLKIGDTNNLFQKDISGITIYCFENKITRFKYKLIDSDYNTLEEATIQNNDTSFFITFENSTQNCYVEIEILELQDISKYFVLNHIDIGLTKIYQNENLISFTVTEQVDKLGIEAPANQFDITIGDYDRIFNPLNPKGIFKYLNENTTFIPYIGMVNENGKEEYENMGKFYYNSISYNNDEVSFSCYNLIDKLKKMSLRPLQIKRPSGSDKMSYRTAQKGEIKQCLQNYLSTNYNLQNDVNIYNDDKMQLDAIESNNLVDMLLQLSMLYGTFHIDRNEKIIIKEVNKTITNKITKSELLEDAIFENINNYRNVIYKTEYYAGNEVKNINYTFNKVLDKPITYVAIKLDNNSGTETMNTDIKFTGVTSVVYDSYNNFNNASYYLFLKIIGNIGDEANVTINYTSHISQNKVENEKKYYDNQEANISISNDFLKLTYIENYNFDKFIDKIYTYKIKCSYSGDPTIKAGDYIEVETNYGIVPIFVQKHTLTFDGGLSGTIEGVE